MTLDPKAMPDDVEKALDFLHSYAQFNHRALIHRDNLRAHIAAQDEKIAELEADNKRLREAQQKAEVCLVHKMPEEAYRHLREAALAQTDNGK